MAEKSLEGTAEVSLVNCILGNFIAQNILLFLESGNANVAKNPNIVNACYLML